MTETTAPEFTATPEAPRYEAVRRNGRPGVLDRTTGKVTQTRTRGIAEEKAAKMNRQHEAETRAASTAQAGEDAIAAVYDQFAANRRGLDKSIRDRAAANDADAATVAASIQTQGDFLTEVGALLGGSSLRQRASAARERAVVARDRDFGTAAPAATEDTTAADAAWDAAAAEIMASPAAAALAATVTPAKARKAAKRPEAAEKPAKLFSVWVGHRIADMLMPLADTEPSTALGEVGRKLRDAKQGRRLARTIRLTSAEREALAGYATQVENDAVEGKDAPLADSARTLRSRLA